MGKKYKSILIKKEKEQQEFQTTQEKLRQKHRIDTPNTVIVEKNNMIKFCIKVLGTFFRIIAWSILSILAIIGLTTLIYPELRLPFLKVLDDIIKQVQTMF